MPQVRRQPGQQAIQVAPFMIPALQAVDGKGVPKIVATRSRASGIGGKRARNCALKLERAALQEDWSTANALLQRLRTDVAQLDETVSQFLS